MRQVANTNNIGGLCHGSMGDDCKRKKEDVADKTFHFTYLKDHDDMIIWQINYG